MNITLLQHSFNHSQIDLGVIYHQNSGIRCTERIAHLLHAFRTCLGSFFLEELNQFSI